VERVSIVTASQLANWLNIPDSEDDTRLMIATAATNRAVVAYCGRSFETTTSGSETAREFVPKSYTICEVDDFYTATNLVVKTGADGTYDDTVAAADYFLEPLNGRQDGLTVPYSRIHGRAWIFPQCTAGFEEPTVQVTAAWGWASVPDDVTQAALIKAAQLFKRKDSIEGIHAGFDGFPGIRISRYEDPHVCDLLRHYQTAAAALLVV
jgi:hypothetical protein